VEEGIGTTQRNYPNEAKQTASTAITAASKSNTTKLGHSWDIVLQNQVRFISKTCLIDCISIISKSD
jgi:hypothetical protein